MNITDFFQEIPRDPQLSAHQMLALRENTFRGFVEVEKDAGAIQLTHTIESKPGQEVVRSLFARVVEEILEAVDSTEDLHRQEEWIDALNFGLGLLFIPTSFTQGLSTPSQFRELVENTDIDPELMQLGYSTEVLMLEVLMAFSPLLQSLRNRSWQRNTQIAYLGTQPLLDACFMLYQCTVAACGSIDHFRRLFIAKDMVLQFRLKTNY